MMVPRRLKLTARGIAHDTLTLVLACAVVIGVGVAGFEIGRSAERYMLFARGMCRLPPEVAPAGPDGPWRTAGLRWAEVRRDDWR